jgi:hypothetical protein
MPRLTPDEQRDKADGSNALLEYYKKRVGTYPPCSSPLSCSMYWPVVVAADQHARKRSRD